MYIFVNATQMGALPDHNPNRALLVKFDFL